jgi:hypothetical protein
MTHPVLLDSPKPFKNFFYTVNQKIQVFVDAVTFYKRPPKTPPQRNNAESPPTPALNAWPSPSSLWREASYLICLWSGAKPPWSGADGCGVIN